MNTYQSLFRRHRRYFPCHRSIPPSFMCRPMSCNQSVRDSSSRLTQQAYSRPYRTRTRYDGTSRRHNLRIPTKRYIGPYTIVTSISMPDRVGCPRNRSHGRTDQYSNHRRGNNLHRHRPSRRAKKYTRNVRHNRVASSLSTHRRRQSRHNNCHRRRRRYRQRRLHGRT